MTYDPFQTSSFAGAFPGIAPQFQSPYATLGANPGFNPLTSGYPGVTGAIHPQLLQQLQLAQILAARAAFSQLQNPLFQNPGLQNPLLGAGIENPLLNPLLAHSQLGMHQQFNPLAGQFGHIGVPYGQVQPMLAPQSWIGQPGLYGGPGAGQVNPLVSQLAARGLYGVGASPWAGF